MNTNEIETVLRESLSTHAHDVTTGTDPWVQVSRAYQRSRTRRTVAVAAVVALGLIVGLAQEPIRANLQQTVRPARPAGPVDGTSEWLLNYTGPPRGPLGDDAGLRKDAMAAAATAVTPLTIAAKDLQRLRVIWADVREGRRLALVVAPVASRTDPKLFMASMWMSGPADGGLLSPIFGARGARGLPSLVYGGRDGQAHVIFVVEPTATVDVGQTTIDVGGTIHRTWSRVATIDSGVVDRPIVDPIHQGLFMIRSQVGEHEPLYSAPVIFNWTGLNDFDSLLAATALKPYSLRSAEVEKATSGARGPGGCVDDVQKALDELVHKFTSDAADTSPQVEWAGSVPTARGGGSVVAVSAGRPGQGRLLQLSRTTTSGAGTWAYDVTVPNGLGPRNAGWKSAWRVSILDNESGEETGQVVGWLFGPDVTHVKVTVDGKPRTTETQDGLGWIEVKPGDEVTVTGQHESGADAVLHPDQVEPVTLPGESRLNQP
jgi:hypothetical protein